MACDGAFERLLVRLAQDVDPDTLATLVDLATLGVEDQLAVVVQTDILIGECRLLSRLSVFVLDQLGSTSPARAIPWMKA